MMTQRNTATIQSPEKGAPDLILDVNFNKKHPDWVRITIGGSKTKVSLKDLFSFMFFMATPEQQVKMIPVVKKEPKQMTEFIRQHSVRVEKDLKKGDMLVVNCNVKVESLVAEQIKEKLEGLQKEENNV